MSAKDIPEFVEKLEDCVKNMVKSAQENAASRVYLLALRAITNSKTLKEASDAVIKLFYEEFPEEKK